MGRFANSTSGFGTLKVRGRRRVPYPPTRMSAFMDMLLEEEEGEDEREVFESVVPLMCRSIACSRAGGGAVCMRVGVGVGGSVGERRAQSRPATQRQLQLSILRHVDLGPTGSDAHRREERQAGKGDETGDTHTAKMDVHEVSARGCLGCNSTRTGKAGAAGEDERTRSAATVYVHDERPSQPTSLHVLHESLG